MSHASTLHAAVIGGGPAGLMAAETLAQSGLSVTVYERMPRPGRKFLLAGRGGLNITHSEDLHQFLTRYRDAASQLKLALEGFPPNRLRAWCEALGVPTFVGSSGRVFPVAMKTSPLLRAWLRRLANNGVSIATSQTWLGWDETGRLRFATPEGEAAVTADITVLALGGASWPQLGSDAAWIDPLRRAGIPITPIAPANCGFLVSWSDIFRARFAGAPLKRIAVTFSGETARGEAMISATGLEGGGVYALSALLREAIAERGLAELHIDLKPDQSLDEIRHKLSRPRAKQSLATFLRKVLQLPPVAIGLLQERAHTAGFDLSRLPPETLADLLKSLPLTLTGTAPIARAISTAGGIAFEGLDANFMLKARPGTFAAGEMLNWEAPTGGYLLQACFATGAAAANGALSWLAQNRC